MLTAVSYQTYQQYAKKYKINVTYICDGKRKRKSFEMLQKEIRDYETTNKVRSGLYV